MADDHSFGGLKLSPVMRQNGQWQIASGQDGEIWGDWLFQLREDGNCKVYSVSRQEQCAEFLLDRREVLCPHSNAVSFGADYYEPGDEFPLLYSNLYNAYSDRENRLEGVCCVYRLIRSGPEFSSRLVQVIAIGFTEDRSLWKSCEGNGDVRSYGNFAVDPERHRLYAFVMRDLPHTTRFFAFDLPSPTAGNVSPEWGVPVVRLEQDDIRDRFDVQYFHYLQGAVCDRQGRIVEVEGFSVGNQEPMLRVIDPERKAVTAQILLEDYGLDCEPEFAARLGNDICYIDGAGRVYRIEWEI